MHIKPKFFIYENVRAFLNSVCTDIDGQDITIKEAIDKNLSGDYNISYQVLNFKDYGNPSSRTRTLVIGVRKDMKEITPFDLYPDKQPERTLRQVIGHLPSLKKMGEISANDIYHNFRKYSPHMEAWIADIKEGQSAFDNTDISKIPHTIKNGVVVYNAQKTVINILVSTGIRLRHAFIHAMILWRAKIQCIRRTIEYSAFVR